MDSHAKIRRISHLLVAAVMLGLGCAVEADDGGLFDMGAGDAPSPPPPGGGANTGGDDGDDSSGGATDSTAPADDTTDDMGATTEAGDTSDSADDGGATDGMTSSDGGGTAGGTTNTGGGGTGQAPQPSTGWYAHCLSAADCESGFGCLTNDVATDGFCSQMCTPAGDPGTCASDPSGILTTMCTVAGGGESVCALDCSQGDPCPTGMVCTVDSQICM